ncbi:kelch motif-containing protein [Streptomyces sp. TRM 70361]|uniref:kelch motif-containing protein n=1 Tax=Streptomyces sp. TRM 70361 TaxID=3116553 RepID=UPI002E7C4F39|nr:kelch motif-containing protein [Streptomyces sp. TRM 70361]MEE1937919.1 kelch motif-containing protein [Streptomyces sp. TRM 70361]
MTYRPSRRFRRIAIASAVVAALAGANGPALYRFGGEAWHDHRINQPGYKAANGHWRTVDVPERYRVNTIHAALLHTGKVLLIAGSGNDAEQFRAKTFRTVLWDPERNTFANIPTPKDLFCAGHTQLPDGRLLVAGGTQRYETLEGDVEKAGGLMVVHNEDPDKPVTLPAGTRFTGRANGRTFASQAPVVVPRARKTTAPGTGKVTVTVSTARIYVEALRKGRRHQTGTQDQYRVHGLRGADRRNVYGIAQKLSFDKKDFQGIRDSYEFDPVAERYVRVDPMNEARWYPTLTTLADGSVLSVSGLDEIGQVVPGKNEIYDPETKKWSYLPEERFFPTYPALFLATGGRILYTGSNAGYGPADEGRTPGLWDLRTNEFREVPGIGDPDVLETSMSVLLPPAQEQRYMVLGGGGVGESRRATARTGIVDLTGPEPRFTPGPDLYAPVRYPSSVILPDDTVLTTNGSGGYRGRGGSDVLRAELYDAKANTVRAVADPLVGRNYHSGALLLPDGRVMTFGSDSLFADRSDTRPGEFQQQIDLYSPPYLFRGRRPELRGTGEPRTVELGGRVTFASEDAARVRTARLVRPGSFTHVTNVEQRSVALEFERAADGLTFTLPDDPSLVPPGYYMLNVLDGEGVPSESVWVRVPVSPDAEPVTVAPD